MKREALQAAKEAKKERGEWRLADVKMFFLNLHYFIPLSLLFLWTTSNYLCWISSVRMLAEQKRLAKERAKEQRQLVSE